jgi:hypothetical protein
VLARPGRGGSVLMLAGLLPAVALAALVLVHAPL